MITFRDRTGRLWSHRLDVSAALRMRDLAGVDVMELAVDPESSTELAADPALVANVLFAIMLPKCEERGFDDVVFGQILPGRRMFRSAICSELSGKVLNGILEFFRTPELLPGSPKSKGGAQMTGPRLWCYLWANAAVAAVNPLPLTFGEITALADARRKHDWSQTASLLSFIGATAGGKQSAEDLDPTGGLAGAQSQRLELTPKTFRLFASAIMGGRN